MKKTISITMALALVATLSTAAFAAEADDGNIKKNITVKAKYVEDIKTSKNYQCRRCVGRNGVHIQRERNKDLER